MKKIIVSFCAALLLSGCSYAISPAMKERADRTITFEALLTDPDLYRGKFVILGGVIGFTAAKQKGTLLGIIQKPLDYWGKPIRTTKSGGHFFLYSPGALDPLLYAPGRELTVAAEVAGTRVEALGKEEFSDPVFVIKEIRLWEKVYPPTSGSPQWGDPLYERYSQPGRPE